MKNTVLCAMGIAMLTACNDDFSTNNLNVNQNANTFAFSTEQTVSLSVNYENIGVNTSVFFEVYDQMPVMATETSYQKIEDIKPLFTGVTSSKGEFNGSFQIPAYVKTVYIWTSAFYAQNLIVADVENGKIVAQDDALLETRVGTLGELTNILPAYLTNGGKAKPYRCWVNKLGSFDSYTGHPDYVFTAKDKNDNPELVYTDDEINYIYQNVINVIDVAKTCPKEYREVADFEIIEESEVAITMLGGNTCWNSSLGYYYYTGDAPTSWKDVTVIALFPNTQDGKWTRGIASPTGVERRDVVQLKYFGPGCNQDATNKFPKGTKIGFVLATNGWDNYTENYTGKKNHFAASTDGLTISANTQKVKDAARTAKFSYSTTDGKTYPIVSFEDYVDDENFSDVVFALKPAAAFVEVPEMKEGTVTSEYSAMFAFEDCWPYEHDYDMNDAMVYYTHQIAKRTSTSYIDGKKIGATQVGNVVEETFTFKTYHNLATYINGIAIKMDKTNYVTRTDSVKMNGATEFSATNFENDILTEDVGQQPDITAPVYKITLKYDATKSTTPVSESSVKVCMFRTQEYNNALIEVHIPYEAPFGSVDYKLFSTAQDHTNLKASPINWYTTEGNFPFAIKLVGADETDLAALQVPANESTRIDNLYPNYTEWVTSKGTKCQNWYK